MKYFVIFIVLPFATFGRNVLQLNTKSFFRDGSHPELIGEQKSIINDNRNHDSSGQPLSNNNNNVIRKGAIVNNNLNDDSGVGATFNNNNNNIILEEGSIVNNNKNRLGGPTSNFNNNNNNKNFRGAVFNNNDNGVQMVRFGTKMTKTHAANMDNINSNGGMIGAYHNIDIEVPENGRHYKNKNDNTGGYGSVFNGNNLQ